MATITGKVIRQFNDAAGSYANPNTRLSALEARAEAPRLTKPGAIIRSLLSPESAIEMMDVIYEKPDRQITLEYVDASNRYVWTPLSSMEWLRWELALNAGGFWTHGYTRIYKAGEWYNDDDASITYTGAWGTGTSTNGIGNSQHNANANTRELEFDVTGVSEVWVSLGKRINCGFARIYVNDTQDLLNTAEFVDVSGVWKLDTYSATTANGRWVKIATGLDTSEVYTIRIVPDGSNNGSASGNYIYFEGYGFPLTNMESLTGETNESVQIVMVAESDAGYVSSIKPSGATGFELSGSDHGNEVINSVTWQELDGTDVSVDGVTTMASVDALMIINAGYARHNESSTTNLANVTSTLLFDPSGCTQSLEIEWLVAGECQYSYIGMWPADAGNWDIGAFIGAGLKTHDLTGDDGAFKGQVKARMIAIWDAGHDYVTAVYIPDDYSVDYWSSGVSTPKYAHIEDKTGATTNKVYVRRISNTSSPTAYSIGDIWRSVWQYRVWYAPGFGSYFI